jgi:hypothetical protein
VGGRGEKLPNLHTTCAKDGDENSTPKKYLTNQMFCNYQNCLNFAYLFYAKKINKRNGIYENVAMLDVHFHEVNSKQICLFQTNQCCFLGQNFRIVAKEKEIQ